jgi:Protein of unknown function (DUF3987)/Domain of unknown function (DUF3854)
MNATVTPLSTADREALERDSWIDPATAEAFGLYRVTSAEGAVLVGRTDREDYAGMVFPIFGPGDDRPKEYVLRRDHPPLEQHNGKQKPKGKYLAPPGRGNRLLFGPGESVDALTDPALPVLLVEGVKKTLAAWRLSRHEDGPPRFLVCGISGVWGWRGCIGKAPDASGARVDVKGVIADIDRITWPAREVFVLYDSDTATNEKVSAARRGLVKELRSRGATVTVPDLAALEDRDKTGFDDMLAHWGPAQVLDWLSSVQETPPPPPIPLDDITLPDLPIEAFPDLLGNMIRAVAQATETPVELAGMLGLATVATCCQKNFVVEGAPGYTEPLSLWTVAALESGNRKSAVVSTMTAPLVQHEQVLKTEGHADRTAKESARLTTEALIKSLRAKAANSADSADRTALQDAIIKEELAMPPAPTIPRLWAQDVTPEKLAVLMADNDEALALLSDEGGLFEMMGGRYSNGIPNLDLYLQGHAGTAVRVDRKSGPPVDLQRPALAIGISPQPSVLRGLTAQEGFRGRGLLARFLYALPPSRLGYRTLETVPVPSTVTTAYTAMCLHLLAIKPERDTTGRIIPKHLCLSPEAHVEWKAFARQVEGHLRPSGEFEHLKDWAGKLPGAVLRVAGLFHCVVHAHEAPAGHCVSVATVSQALLLLAVLAKHTRAVFDLMGSDPDLEGARRIMRWVERERLDQFTARDCFNKLRGSYSKVVQLGPFFKMLVERGQLVPMESTYTGKGRPPSQRYAVHPDLIKVWR